MGLLDWLTRPNVYVEREAMNKTYAEAYVRAVDNERMEGVSFESYNKMIEEATRATELVRSGLVSPERALGDVLDGRGQFTYLYWSTRNAQKWGEKNKCEWCGSVWVADKFHPGSCGECGAGR